MTEKRRFDRHSILSSAIIQYGEDAQIDMMIEEMSELTKALLKLRRMNDADIGSDKHTALINDIREEIADVQIVLDQMKIIYGDVSEYDEKKVSRLFDRLLEGKAK